MDESNEEWQARTDVATRKRVDELYDLFSRFVRKSLTAFAVIGLFSTIGVGGAVYAVAEIKSQQDDIEDTAVTAARLAKQTTLIADQNRRLVRQIQDQRREAAEQSCKVRNNQNRGISIVLKRFKVDRTDPDLFKLFPVTDDCKTYAKEIAP